MKNEMSLRIAPRRRVAKPASEDGGRARTALGADENSFVENLDVDDDYERGVEEITRRRGWAGFQ